MTPKGIVDFEIAYPQGRITVEEMHERSGVSVPEILEITQCAEFPVLGPDEQAWELAVDAADAVLGRTGVDTGSISRVIYAGNGYWDSPGWSPAAKVADELGVTRAHCFEVTNFCNALTLAIRIASEGIQPGSGPALVVSAERFAGSVDRRDPDSKGMFNFGDAAVAVLIGAECSFAYLGSSARTDPQWCDYYVGDYHESGVYSRRRGRRKGLADAYNENYTVLVEQTLDAIGRKVSDVDYLLVGQNDKRIQERLLESLDFPRERTVFNHTKLGHMGCADTLIALGQLRDDKALETGDLVLLATSGLGFSWSVTAFEYRAG